MFFTNINLWVVLVAAIVGMAIGFGWHAQWAFGKLWLKERMLSNPSWQASTIKPMLHSYTAIAITTLVMSLVISAIFNSLLITSVGGIILTGFLLWLGIVAPTKLSDYLFGGETFKFLLIDAGYALVEIVVMSLIIGLWG